MDLDRYGAGCRCLLRIRENLGQPPLSDASFIANGQALYPDWADRPGAADVPRLCEIAVRLGISFGGEILRDYDRILACCRSGHPVLIRSRRPPRRQVPERTALLVEMDERGMKLWVPTSDGSSDTVWDRREEFSAGVRSAGIVLYTDVGPREGAPIALGLPSHPTAEAKLPPVGTAQWADWSAAVIREARQSIREMSPRRWMVAHPDDVPAQALVGQIDSGSLNDSAVELPRLIRWHSAQDGRSYVLVEFFSLSRQPVPALAPSRLS